jgi:hypothetical protein
MCYIVEICGSDDNAQGFCNDGVALKFPTLEIANQFIASVWAVSGDNLIWFNIYRQEIEEEK